MPDPTFVRIKDRSTGYMYSIVQSAYEADPEQYQLLKQDAVDHNGAPLAPEFPEDPASSGQKATNTTKENS